MNVHELNRDEIRELKQNYLCEIMDKRTGETPSWHELAHADEIVTDEEIFSYYAGTYFVKDDFECNYVDVPDMTPEEMFLEFQSNEAETDYFNY